FGRARWTCEKSVELTPSALRETLLDEGHPLRVREKRLKPKEERSTREGGELRHLLVDHLVDQRLKGGQIGKPGRLDEVLHHRGRGVTLDDGLAGACRGVVLPYGGQALLQNEILVLQGVCRF